MGNKKIENNNNCFSCNSSNRLVPNFYKAKVSQIVER